MLNEIAEKSRRRKQASMAAAATNRSGRSFGVAGKLRTPRIRVKRVGDLLGAFAALATLSIPMVVVALLVHIKLGSPVIFRQTRPGRDGKPFEMFKFRTMTDERNIHGELLPDSDRLTHLGSTLRTTSLDELPELWNVLRGDMSLVGPRPLLVRYTQYFSDEEMRRLSVRPGITGWAQVNGRNLASWDERLAMDVWYVLHLSPWIDLKILGLTISSVFRRHGVVVDPESTMKNLDEERKQVGRQCQK